MNQEEKLLVPFRTWLNGNTDQATKVLSQLFELNIPHRWNIIHLYQAVLNQKSHLSKLNQITTLAGYIRWKLTGERVLGIGGASGTFPIEPKLNQYNAYMLNRFNELIKDENYPWSIEDVLPKVLVVGENAVTLTNLGAKLLVYGFYSGVNTINVEEGRPRLVRNPNGNFNLVNLKKQTCTQLLQLWK